mgnify:CR=1 FL=1
MCLQAIPAGGHGDALDRGGAAERAAGLQLGGARGGRVLPGDGTNPERSVELRRGRAMGEGLGH